MIDQSVIDRYVEESSLNMKEDSKINSQNMLTKFFSLTTVEFSDLTKADLIEMYSKLHQTATSSFESHRSKIRDFAKWMYEQGYGTAQLVNDIIDIQFTDINRFYLYDLYYFRSIEELWDTMDSIFEDHGSEFDTFRSAALLVWLGIEIDDLPDMLKTDLDEEDMTIIHPRTKEKIEIPPVDFRSRIFGFLIDYRDATKYDSKKFGGRLLNYMKSSYLFRSYKNAQFTVKQIRNLSYSANKLAQKYQRAFQWDRIYLSGLYYRINEYEKEFGTIRDDLAILEKFFVCNQKGKNQRKLVLLKKYNEYQEFKNHVNL